MTKPNDLQQFRRNHYASTILGRHACDQMIDLRLGPNVDPARWFVEYNNFRVKPENLGQENLLLISTAQPVDRHGVVGNFYLELLDRQGEVASLLSLVNDPGAETLQAEQRIIRLSVEGDNKSFALPIF